MPCTQRPSTWALQEQGSLARPAARPRTEPSYHTTRQAPTPQLLAALRRHKAAGLGLSSITAAELFFGVAQSGSLRNRSALNQFLEPLEIADFDCAAAAAYGPLRAVLEAAGTPIGPLDTQIAAHALTLGVTLVSHNTREFARVPGLRLANWVATP